MIKVDLLLAVRIEITCLDGRWIWAAYRKDGRRTNDIQVANGGKSFATEGEAITDARMALQPDPHAVRAIEVYGELTSETRAKAKTINYNALYGV